MLAKSERKRGFFSVRSGRSTHQQKELNKSGTWKCPSSWGHCHCCFFCSQQALKDVSTSWRSSLKVEQWWLRGTLQPSGTDSHASFQLRLGMHFSSHFAACFAWYFFSSTLWCLPPSLLHRWNSVMQSSTCDATAYQLFVSSAGWEKAFCSYKPTEKFSRVVTQVMCWRATLP